MQPSTLECEIVQFQSYSVKPHLNSCRLQFIEIFVQIFSAACADPTLLDSVPSTLWTLLCDWFFEFKYALIDCLLFESSLNIQRFHNSYHCQFFNLLKQSLSTNYRPLLKNVLGKTKLVNRMISHFTDNSSPTGKFQFESGSMEAVTLFKSRRLQRVYNTDYELHTPIWGSVWSG
jgi:hypothetical protein